METWLIILVVVIVAAGILVLGNPNFNLRKLLDGLKAKPAKVSGRPSTKPSTDGVSRVRKQDVIHDWMKLVDNAYGRAEEFFDLVIQHLQEVGAPKLEWQYTTVRAVQDKGKENQTHYVVGDYKKERRRMLLVNCHPHFQIFIGAKDYGSYLVVRRIVWDDSFYKYGLSLHSIFATEAAALSLTVVHRAVLRAIKDLMAELDQDTTKIDAESKEFLKIW